MRPRSLSRTFLVGSALFLSLLLTLGLVAVEWSLSASYKRSANEMLVTKVEMMHRLLTTRNNHQQNRVEQALHMLAQSSEYAGLPHLVGTTSLGSRTVPALYFGPEAQTGHYALVDDISEVSKALVSLFVRQGDTFIRIATSDKNDDGTRPLGTEMDRTSPVYRDLLDGKSYYGPMIVLGESFIAGYEPIQAADGTVIGAWGVAYPLQGSNNLFNYVVSQRLLDHGFYAILNEAGTPVVFSETYTADQVKAILNNPDGWERFTLSFDPWKLQLAGGYPKSDLHAHLLRSLLFHIPFAVLGMGFLLGLLWVGLRTLVVRPLREVTDGLAKVQAGDLTVELPVRSQNEIGALATGFNAMTHSVADGMARTQQAQNEMQEGVDLVLQHMKRFAEGDLTTRIAQQRDGDMGRLYGGFDHAINRMETMLRTVTEHVEETAKTADPMHQATRCVADGAAQQADQALQVTAAIEEMTRTIKDVARNAASASTAVVQSNEVAREGYTVMQSMIEKTREIAASTRSSAATVERLGASSQQIDEAVALISDIAAQTNLLALNATIEAARAGEHGRGFAIVADEVRHLARRTTEATRQIGDVVRAIQADTQAVVTSIDASTHQMTEGIALSERTGAALDQVVKQMQEALDVTHMIAAASEEQSATSTQIAHSIEAINSISRTTAQQAAALSEGVGAIHGKTQGLERLVAEFTLSRRTRGPVHAADGDLREAELVVR